MSDTADSEILYDLHDWSAFFQELGKESDRAAAVLLCAWLDNLLQRKLLQHFCKGNAESRKKLFSEEGGFGRFSSRIDAAFCLGWFEADVYHDLHILRKIRNCFAHQVHGLTYESPEIRKLIDSMQVPHRDYYDWGQLKCAAKMDGTGLVVYSGEAPDDEELGEPLRFPAGITFRLGASKLIAHLAAHLNVGIVLENIDTAESARGDSSDLGQ